MNLIIKIRTHLPQPTTIKTHESLQPPILRNSRTNIIYNQTPKKKKSKAKSQRGQIGEGGREDKRVDSGSQIGMGGRERKKDGEGGRVRMK